MTISWGNLREAQLANRQSFFWTNTAPQHPDMNQGWWLTIEEWERALVTEYGKATGFAGPVQKHDDPLHKNVEQVVGRLTLRQNFRLPNSFWKIVLFKQKGKLLSAAFILHQDELIKNRAPRNAPVSTYRSSVTDIETATGLEFNKKYSPGKGIKILGS